VQTVAVPLDIQWTDTDACLHLQCLCGVEVHSDTPYIERITCEVCGRTYILPSVVFAEVRGDGGSSDVPVS
jgi:hypothetical protein